MQSSAGFVFEWPPSWDSPNALRVLEGTAFKTICFRGAPPPAVRQAAESNGFRCMVEGEGGFRWRAHGEMDWAQPGPCIAINDAFWPSVGGGAVSENGASAGPTGTPWLDANGWLILLARARAGGKPVWIRAKDPEAADKLEPANYRIALAEAFAYGAVRPLWLGPKHAADLLAGRASWWPALCADAEWWGKRAVWQDWPALSQLLIASDFSGPNEYLGTETLLLAARRNLAFQPVPSGNLSAATLRNRKAVLWLDPVEPPALLEQFVRSGGLLICRKSPWKGGPLNVQHDRFQISSLGAGRQAVASADWDDPWVLAQDVHLLVSRRHDPVRIFNPGLLQQYVAESPDRSRQLVHLMNYALRPGYNLVTMAPSAKVAAARCHVPGQPEAQALAIREVSGRQEMQIPRFPIALTVELELQRNA